MRLIIVNYLDQYSLSAISAPPFDKYRVLVDLEAEEEEEEEDRKSTFLFFE